MQQSTILGLLIIVLLGCAEPSPPTLATANKLQYPTTAVDVVTDRYHGTDVADPYRWLEALESPAVAEWIAAQNAVSKQWFDNAPQQPQIRAAVERAIRYQRWGHPVRRGDRYFYTYSDGEKNQPLVYVTSDLKEVGEVLLDPNGLREDGTKALTSYEISDDGRYFAYGVSDGGSDWRTWHFLDVETGKPLQEVLDGIKFSEVSFTADGAHVYYSRYPDDADGQPNDQAQVAIYRHRLGSPQLEDVLVFNIEDHPRRDPYGTVSDDGAFLIIHVSDGFDANGVYYLPLDQGPAQSSRKPTRLLDDWDARYQFLGNDGHRFYFFTDESAPRGRVIAIDTTVSGNSAWTEPVAEVEDALVDVNYVGGHFVLSYLRNAHSYVVVVDRDGATQVIPELPGFGSVVGFSGRADDPVTYFTYEDFATRESVFRYDVSSNEMDALWSGALDAQDAHGAQIVTEQVFIESTTGVQVPAFLVRRRDVEPNGQLPTLLYGYGGFNVALTPAYSAMPRAWIDAGGLFVSANLRGGGEFGKEWHQAGTKTNKQNVFDDFFAVAEWLIESGYTRPANLGITGRSNGGLLVAAALTQRPDLFGAALPAVGVLDMLRYHTASANARAWSSDYGLSENPQEFEALYAYSPYHRLREGICYPPTLVTSADRDDRVVPWHSYKFAARLQAVQSCSAPTLIMVETRAGHGAGKPIAMLVDDYAAQLGFAAHALGLISGGGPPGELTPD
jgi:prolyl oligopeptidase